MNNFLGTAICGCICPECPLEATGLLRMPSDIPDRAFRKRRLSTEISGVAKPVLCMSRIS